MRLAIVNHEYPPLAGGAGTATAEIAVEMAALGHEVLVVTSEAPGAPLRQKQGRLSVSRIPAGCRSLSSPSVAELLRVSTSLAWNLRNLLQSFQPDGLVAFFAIPSGWLSVRAGRRLGVPVIVSLRGSDVPGFPGRRISPWLRPLTQRLVRSTLLGADVVAPNCDYLYQLATRFLPDVRNKSLVIGNGISRDWLATEPANSGSGDLGLVTVGQLIARKRVDRCFVATRRLADAGVPVRLTVIGDGPSRRKLEEQASSFGISGRVAFLGYQSRQRIQQLLRKHDAFLFTSEGEGMSNAVLEAMASGLPIITTTESCRTLVTTAGCGEYVAANDSDMMAAKLARLYRDPNYRHRLALAGIRHARTCTWRRSAEQFIAALQQG